MGWEGRGRYKREGTYVCLWLIPVDVWQKPTQYCKTAILQLKKFLKTYSVGIFRKGKQVPTVQNRELYSISCDTIAEKNMKKNAYICISEVLCCTAVINTML